MSALKTGEKVRWTWGAHEAEGKIEKIYTRTVTRKIAGTEVKRKASKDEPAYYITQDDGGAALKSASEVRKA